MSHTMEYLTWTPRRNLNSAAENGVLRPDPLGRPFHGRAQTQGQRGAHLSAQRAAWDLLRLCFGTEASPHQPLHTDAADEAE
jgi:hypothetical protein